MQGKKSFLLYTDQREVFDELSDEDAGKLIKHIFAYVNDEDPITSDKLLKVAFLPIKTQLKRDLKTWENKQEQRKDAAKKSVESRQRTLTSVNERSISFGDNVNVNVNGNVNDNVNVNGNVNKQIGSGALFSLEDIFNDFIKEKPLKRPYFDRMAEVHSTDSETIEGLFKKWATLKEGENMTIAKAENSFNLYLGNNLKNIYKPQEKANSYKGGISKNVFDELYEDLQKQKLLKNG
jgi:hypothetical protein